jgi:filamentous hemagglutinin
MNGGTFGNNGVIAPGGQTLPEPDDLRQFDLGLPKVLFRRSWMTSPKLRCVDGVGYVNYGGTLSLNGNATAGNFALVTSTTRTLASTFATVNGSIAGAVPVYNGTGLTIGISAAGQWTGLGDGVTWGNVLNWGGGVLPGAADDVVIASSGLTLIVSSGSFGVNSLTLGPGRSLQVAGGSFAIGNASTLGADLTVSSGTLTLNGATTVAGAFTQSGGTLNGAGSLSLNAGGTWSGGLWGGGINVVNAVGQAFNIIGTGTLGFEAATLTNNGTLNWSGSHIEILGNGTVNNSNGALLDITADYDFGDRWTGVGVLTLNNLAGATLRKSAGTGISSFEGGRTTPNGVNFNNAGARKYRPEP